MFTEFDWFLVLLGLFLMWSVFGPVVKFLFRVGRPVDKLMKGFEQ